MSPRLPHHRRRNWRILCRNHCRAIWLAIAALLLAGLIIIGEQFMIEQHAKLDAQNAYASVKGSQLFLRVLGTPGSVRDDIVEQTTNLKVGKVK